MKNLRNEKGITLVALVVTIIVLLILAGVSLSLVAGGNGIINKAATASDRTIEGSAREQTELKLAELVADYFEAKYVNSSLPTGVDNQLDYIANQASAGTPAGDYTITVSAAGALTVKRTKDNMDIATGTVSEEGKLTAWNKATGTSTPSV